MLSKLREARRVFRSIVDNPSVSKHRARAIGRAARWQVNKRIGARRALVKVGPAEVYCYPGSTGGSSVLYTGLYDWDEMTFMLRYLRPGDHFVDVGANIGAYSVFAARIVGDVQVTAVEPDLQARERLIENLALNSIDRPTISDHVLGDKVGSVTFSSGRDTLNSIVDGESVGGVTLPMTTLDELAEPVPALVKIDVEGAEQEVLKGAGATLSADSPPALIMELNGLCERFGASPRSIRELLAGYGYALYEYDGTADRLDEFTGDGYPAGKNVIALHSVDDAKRRLAESPINARLAMLPIGATIERR